MPADEDNWRGIIDPVERRKIQSRIRQRAWRARKQTSVNHNRHDRSLLQQGYGVLVNAEPVNAEDLTHNSFQQLNKKLIPPILPYSTLVRPCSSQSPIVLPLSADHCLITLVQYNVVRAFLQNMSLLSLLHNLPQGCSNSFGVSQLDTTPTARIPSDLKATSLQQSEASQFWINAVPFPALRDNLILMAGQYDSRELLLDLGLRVYEGFDDIERCGFLVWGHPWLAASWEVSEGFVRRWGFLLKRCPEVVDAANAWRLIRGEERLLIEF